MVKKYYANELFDECDIRVWNKGSKQVLLLSELKERLNKIEQEGNWQSFKRFKKEIEDG